MIKKLSIALTICIGLCFCNRKTEKESHEPKVIFPHAIDLGFLIGIEDTLFESISSKKDSIEIIFVNGNCSICIVEFLGSINNSKTKPYFTYLYIVAANDTFTIEYYLKTHKRELHHNEHLILNKNKEFERYNPLINLDSTPKIITDSTLAIVSIELLNYN